MLGQFSGGRVEATQIDNAGNVIVLCRSGNVSCALQFFCFEVTFLSHGMDEVVEDIHSDAGLVNNVLIEQIPFDDVYL